MALLLPGIYLENIPLMRRTIKSAVSIWKNRSVLWPLTLLARTTICALKNTPRGLIVEPSQGCTGNCKGCSVPETPMVLKKEKLNSWLNCSPAKPVTIHLSGKHSDPLASSEIQSLAETAIKNCSMLSISTIGLGMKPEHCQLPVDRWIFSIPAATDKTWEQLRGNNRLDEVLENIRMVKSRNTGTMVEVVLTIWKASLNDENAFRQLKQKQNWQHSKIVFGRYDPEGNHFGRLSNIALKHKDCPYMENSGNSAIPALKQTPTGCPLAGYLFLDAAGTLRPCPFTGDESPYLKKAVPESWEISDQWREKKQERSYPACKWCP